MLSNDKKHCALQVHAKCILVGEHTVLRGHPAIVFPIKSRYLSLNYYETDQSFEIKLDSPYQETFLTLFNGTLQNAYKRLNIDYCIPTGEFHIKNNIPMGAGMGFSAALCALITEWLIWKGLIKQEDLLNFARSLENAYHGTSSGVDIAGAITDTAIIYWMNKSSKPLWLKWRPNFYLSYCEKTSSTVDCVNNVNQLKHDNPQLAESIDQEMAQSTLLAEKALKHSPVEGLQELIKAINQANDCFAKWGLINKNLESHLKYLHVLGAIAAKPTGSGNGGYVLSLWKEPPPKHIPIKFIRVL